MAKEGVSVDQCNARAGESVHFNWEEEGDVRELSIFLTYGTKLSAQSQHYVARKTQQGNMENDSLIIHLIRVYISSVLYKPTGWCA